MSSKSFSVGEVLSAADVNEYLANGYWKRIDRKIISSGSAVASTSFSSLSSSFRIFRLTYSLVSTGSSLTTCAFRLNNDTGANYNDQSNESVSTTFNSTDRNSVYAPIWDLFSPVVATGDIIITKLTTGLRAVYQVRTSAYASAYTPAHWWINSSGNWNNTSSLINRIDVLIASGTIYGVIALEGMVGI